MVTTDDLYMKSLEQLKQLGHGNLNEELLKAIAAKVPKTSLDATLVAGTDDKELDYIVKNFMKKKLDENDAEAGRAKLDVVIASMKGINRKQRAAVYYALVITYGKESAYL